MVGPGEGSLPGLWAAAFSLCPHLLERERECSGVSSCKGTDLIRGSPPHDLTYP